MAGAEILSLKFSTNLRIEPVFLMSISHQFAFELFMLIGFNRCSHILLALSDVKRLNENKINLLWFVCTFVMYIKLLYIFPKSLLEFKIIIKCKNSSD